MPRRSGRQCNGRCASTRPTSASKDPLKRAAYLCELGGAPVRAEDNTAMPSEFLAQQMAWREGLEEAATLQAVEAIAADIDRAQAAAHAELARAIDGAADSRPPPSRYGR